jgi:hypothetical protein
VWLSLDEAAVLIGLLELLAEPTVDAGGRPPELDLLLERWQSRLGTRLTETITGLAADGYEREA